MARYRDIPDAAAEADQLDTQPTGAVQKGFSGRAWSPSANGLKFYLIISHVGINDRQRTQGAGPGVNALINETITVQNNS